MKRTELKIDQKLLNDFPQSNLNVNMPEKEENLKDVKNVKELRKFFSGFKRAMKFGSSSIETGLTFFLSLIYFSR